MKIAVIGAGASGIIASLNLSKKHEVILLEKNDKIGKKILVTGNGKCNLWNKNLSKDNLEEYYYTDNYETLNNILKYKDKTYEYLKKELNIYTREKNDYIYPYSNSALSIRSLFEREILKQKNIKLLCNFEVKEIKKEENKFKIYGNSLIEVDKVIIACGGLASKLGTNSLENLLKNIKINKCSPALVPLKSDFKYLKDLTGLRTDVELSLYSENNLLRKEKGELQFTDYGISGIVTLNLSSLISKNNNLKLYIDFMPGVDIREIFNNFDKEKTIEELLETYFNYKLLFTLLNISGIKKDSKLCEIKSLDNLIKNIKSLNINITGVLDFDRAQVMTGGVSLNDIDNNLMLKEIPGLYVIGESLDVDGICGGYNLAFAFITGLIVGEL